VIAGYGDAIESIQHSANMGQGAAVNSGFAAAIGEVVWFLDADDALLPGALRTVAGIFAQQPGLSKVHAPMTIVDAHGRGGGELIPADPEILAVGDNIDQVIRFRNHAWAPMSGNAFSARALRNVLPLPEEHYAEAADSFLCEQVPLHGPIGRSPEPLSAYRIHGGNQFANARVTSHWLREKIRREAISHEVFVDAANARGLVVPRDPTEALDVALTGYRLASLRLDPARHISIGVRPDRRLGLLRQGLTAAWCMPGLPMPDRAARSLWFIAAAALPGTLIAPLFDAWVPDSPSPPFWRRRRGRVLRRSRS
jgi:GT2 family glycosyltransferase